MATTVNGLNLRKVFGREDWLPPEPFGPDGWRMVARDYERSVIVSSFDWEDGVEYTHASITGNHGTPPYEDLALLHEAVWGTEGYAYQMFVPRSSHVNIHPHALHLWGRSDGRPLMLDFGSVLGSI